MKENRKCIFCGKYVKKENETYTEEAEICHKKCLENFIKFWEERNEFFNLMGW